MDLWGGTNGFAPALSGSRDRSNPTRIAPNGRSAMPLARQERTWESSALLSLNHDLVLAVDIYTLHVGLPLQLASIVEVAVRGSGDNEQFLVVALQQLHYLFAGRSGCRLSRRVRAARHSQSPRHSRRTRTCHLLLLLFDTLDNGIDVLPYLSIAARLNDGLVEDSIGFVHLHHAVVVEEIAESHSVDNVLAQKSEPKAEQEEKPKKQRKPRSKKSAEVVALI